MSRNILKEPSARKPGVTTISALEEDLDELFEDAVKIVCQYDRASASLLQRRLDVGYARAARLLDQLHAAGIVSEHDGSKPRDVLISSPNDIYFTKIFESEDTSTKKAELESNIPEEEDDYKSPGLDVVRKFKDNKWKYSLHDLVNDNSFIENDEVTIPLGFTEDKKLLSKRLTELKHLIITGNIISEKEAYLDTVLTSLLMKDSPQKLKLILINDGNYLNMYHGLPHLLAPAITDHQKVVSALRWTLSEMDRRQKQFVKSGCRNLETFNEMSGFTALPNILVVIHQYDNIYNFSSEELGDATDRLTALGHDSGIHLLLTTNRLTNKEVSPQTQSNIPSKMFFRVTNNRDAGQYKSSEMEKLNQGEALINFGFENELAKLNSIYTHEENVKEVVRSITQE